MGFARVGAVLAVVGLIAAAGSASTSPAATPPKWLATACAQLGRLPVRPAVSMAGYGRARFGPAWEDVDGNHCDTRNDILRRDLHAVMLESGSSCVVARGILNDPYTGKTIRYLRGIHTSSLVQIDHLVPLAAAWRTGASTWTPARRLAYANDPFILLAVDGAANEAKGDDDAAEWLPRPTYRCRYVAKQIAIKTKYHLWTTSSEHSAMSAVLGHCP